MDTADYFNSGSAESQGTAMIMHDLVANAPWPCKSRVVLHYQVLLAIPMSPFSLQQSHIAFLDISVKGNLNPEVFKCSGLC